jgi:hypothetical protein
MWERNWQFPFLKTCEEDTMNILHELKEKILDKTK